MRTILLRFDREADELHRRRAAQIAAEIEREREIQEREDRLERTTHWWLQQREANKDLMTLTAKYQEIVDDSPLRRKLRAKMAELEELDKQISRVAARRERNTLLARGVVRGRRK